VLIVIKHQKKVILKPLLLKVIFTITNKLDNISFLLAEQIGSNPTAVVGNCKTAVQSTPLVFAKKK
jgi:hypothetical protein